MKRQKYSVLRPLSPDKTGKYYLSKGLMISLFLEPDSLESKTVRTLRKARKGDVEIDVPIGDDGNTALHRAAALFRVLIAKILSRRGQARQESIIPVKCLSSIFYESRMTTTMIRFPTTRDPSFLPFPFRITTVGRYCIASPSRGTFRG